MLTYTDSEDIENWVFGLIISILIIGFITGVFIIKDTPSLSEQRKEALNAKIELCMRATKQTKDQCEWELIK